MSSRLLLLLVLVGLTLSIGGVAGVACSDQTTDPAASPDAAIGGESGAADSGKIDGGGASDTGGGTKTTCEITRKYFEDCGNEADLNCGDKFDAWCTKSDQAINSIAYRNAEALCLTMDNCDGKKRRDCEYTHYNSETPTASEKALVAAYCQTCEPSDITGCTTRATKYDPSKGIASVGDIYVAAWELTDALCDEIKTKCTGGAVDAGLGPDASTCAKAFGGCSADIYLAALPDCPK